MVKTTKTHTYYIIKEELYTDHCYPSYPATPSTLSLSLSHFFSQAAKPAAAKPAAEAAPAEPKPAAKKKPFDHLPKSEMNMDDFKRLYWNNTTGNKLC